MHVNYINVMMYALAFAVALLITIWLRDDGHIGK